ncbi:TrmH family RNA methyltransferase [Melghirimyces profundicolus]|uniref:TrmH family RNA methyltransferase n=1 Tax=Melghirimyces profundicolus TaxID=1242148 RepID=A0A2T6BG39_9BACL|nr:RNA methyltransferase [Melghirimyces profundicolus]PTX55032.1 TrmH family RNA methyltransferase [Melghirimyces profundicolus]
MKILQITSARNEKVKRWRKLSTRKGRDEYGSILIEGEKLLGEAIRAGWQVRSVLVSEEGREMLDRLTHLEGIPVYSLYPSTFSQLVDTQTPQGIAAEVVVPHEREPWRLTDGGPVLLLDAVQDPGNLGAILRTAEAAGARDIWLGNGTVDPYNPKVVRSAMGSLFRSRIRRVKLMDAIPKLKKQGYFVVGTAPRAEKNHFETRFPLKTAFLLGNEGRGVSPEVEGMTDATVRIPMPGEVESLNVAVTAGILLFEWVRQKGRESR